MRVLVVEDDPISAIALVWELQHHGHEVIGPAATIEEGMALALAHHPTLALLDIDLTHKGDGVTLARQLQQLSIASVFVSGQATIARAHQDLAMGLIAKPYDPRDVVHTLAVVDALLRGTTPPPPQIPSSLQLFH